MSDDPPRPAAIGKPVVHEENGRLTLFFDDATVQSHMLQADPVQLVLEYTRLMMGFLLFHPAPARIAMIGLGGGSLAKYCERKLPDADFTAIEISPEVIALRDAFGIPPDGPRFRILCEDGAEFVRNQEPDPLDVLLVDGFDRGGQPDQLCSAAFYDDCRLRLAPGGVLVANLYADDRAADSRVERIRDSFAGKIAVIKADESENKVVFAGTEAPFPPPFSELVERLRALEASHPVCLDVTLRKILQYEEPRPATHRRGRRRGFESPRETRRSSGRRASR
jgi:spermidine synthase